MFWTVTAVIAVMPKTPSALNVFRSAWIPAPPELSEPATVKAMGVGGDGWLIVPSMKFGE